MRNRVASSDWCASRIVVSVSSSGFCLRTHWQNFSGPSASSRSRNPWGTGPAACGTTGVGSSRWASNLPLVSGRPLTMTSPRYDRIFVARSRRRLNRNRSGVSSMNVVVASPAANVGWPIRFSRNGMFVFTPRMRNSRRARSVRRIVSSNVLPQVVNLTSNESK